MNLQLSVIILNYNVQYFLEQCLISVQAALQTINSEIIVVDNNSSDGSCKMVQQRFPSVKFIQNTQNLGFPKGNNIGVAQSQGKYICILNPDTVVAEDTFTKVLKFVETQTNLGIVGCKLIDGTGNFLPESKRGIPTPFVAFTKILGLYKISNRFGHYYAQHLKENQTGKVAVLVGAFMVMTRTLYLELGGFDENCFMYSDDIDLSYLSLKKGKDNYYFSQTTVIHYKGESTNKDAAYMRRFQEALSFFYKKHFKISLLFDFFMKAGILFFSLIKMFQGQPWCSISTERYILLSDNEMLREKLENQFQKTVIRQNNAPIVANKKKTMVVLDQNFLSFKTIIALLEQHKNKGFLFRIIPQNTSFMIGSDSSFDKGMVRFIAD